MGAQISHNQFTYYMSIAEMEDLQDMWESLEETAQNHREVSEEG